MHKCKYESEPRLKNFSAITNGTVQSAVKQVSNRGCHSRISKFHVTNHRRVKLREGFPLMSKQGNLCRKDEVYRKWHQLSIYLKCSGLAAANFYRYNKLWVQNNRHAKIPPIPSLCRVESVVIFGRIVSAEQLIVPGTVKLCVSCCVDDLLNWWLVWRVDWFFDWCSYWCGECCI